MSVETIESLLEQFKTQLQGEITSDEVIKKDLVKQVMYKKSSLIAVGTKLLPIESTDVLEEKLYVYRPSEIEGEFPVPEDATAARAKPAPYHSVDFDMAMAEYRFMITYWALARGRENWAYDAQTRAGADWFAKCYDQQILDALYAGAGATTVNVASGAEWDTESAEMDPEGDIMKAWNAILDESNVGLEDIRNVSIVYPAKVDSTLRGLKMIGNIQQSLQQYLKGSFGFSFYPTRYYDENGATKMQDDALLMVTGRDTGVHRVYSGTVIPMSEVKKVDRGTEYIVRAIFGTKIMPESDSVATSTRICKIGNVI